MKLRTQKIVREKANVIIALAGSQKKLIHKMCQTFEFFPHIGMICEQIVISVVLLFLSS